MGQRTPIAWADSSLNPAVGCSGCELGEGCFALQLGRRFAGKNGWPKDFRKPELRLERLAELRRWKDLTGKKRPTKPHLDGRPRLVFLCDTADPFDAKLPPEWLARRWQSESRQTVLEFLASLPHVLIILTKQAGRMAEFFAEFPCPPNVWLGVSVTNQKSADERVPWLLKCKTRVRIISHEPATGSVDWAYGLPKYVADKGSTYFHERTIQWVISGGMSGRKAAPCDLAWLRHDRDQARVAGCAFFAKQLGAHSVGAHAKRLSLRHPSGADPAEFPADLQHCREVPKL